MKIAMLAPIARRPADGQCGPPEKAASLLTEGLAGRGIEVTLFAAGDSQIQERLVRICPQGFEGAPEVSEYLHVSEVFERGQEFDLIHNHLDYLPLTYMGLTKTPVVTTIHGSPSPQILPVYKKYNRRSFFVALSEADKHPELDYIATIPPGIDLGRFPFRPDQGGYLLFFGPLHHENGAGKCIEIARQTGMRLVLVGIIQDQAYFDAQVRPYLDGDRVLYVGPGERQELFGGACALLHPLPWDEPSGISALEAMACGTPVIALNRGRLAEMIADGLTGFLVPDAAEMAGAVCKARQLDRSRCRQWVEERFSADRMVRDYLRVYERIIHRTRREDHRPWGFYEILADGPDHKVKRITVVPGQRLSYQRHFRRSEHWYVISGQAVVTKNGKEIELTSGQAVDLPVKTWHRVQNPGPERMVLIEVQTGHEFGEEDIERSEDDYGRV